MKVRTGFVSNSSSSSFVAVGIPRHKDGDWKNEDPKFVELIEKMVNKSLKDIDYEDLECPEKEGISIFANDAEPFFVGLDIEPHIEEDKRLSEMKEEFRQLAKDKFDVDIPINKMKFKVDTESSG